MKICVYGAGAIGGYLAVELALTGYGVCAIARGAHLEAIQRNGLRLRIDGEEKTARIPASEEPGDFGPQDTVICALKGSSIMERMRTIRARVGYGHLCRDGCQRHTVVVFLIVLILFQVTQSHKSTSTTVIDDHLG